MKGLRMQCTKTMLCTTRWKVSVTGGGGGGRVVSDRMAPVGATGSLYHQKALIKYTHSIYILIYDEAVVVNTP